MTKKERVMLDTLMENVYELLQEETTGFLDCEGSGLYFAQSACNHSCEVCKQWNQKEQTIGWQVVS